MRKKNSVRSGSVLRRQTGRSGGKKTKYMGLHDKLMKNSRVYARWHKHPFQSLAQWVILLALIGGVGYLLLNSMNDPLVQNLERPYFTLLAVR